jgi:diadenosine tetraphosphatase ApaH/serine/threonine PP2A family protein phosphatase
MRYLVLSDLHSNLEATQAVLADARAAGYERVVCLGDIVGYGGSPNEVVDLLRSLEPAGVIRGNHDKVAAGVEEGENFNDIARAAALWTREMLTPGNRRWLAELPRGPLDQGGFLISHGTPLDEDAYILSEMDALVVFDSMEFTLAFFGHSHFACAFVLGPDGARLEMLEDDDCVLDVGAGARYLVNPGSIGQPRDHNPKAAYALFDSASGRVTVRRVAYDVRGAQRRITDSGLPYPLAYRLEFGV